MAHSSSLSFSFVSLCLKSSSMMTRLDVLYIFIRWLALLWWFCWCNRLWYLHLCVHSYTTYDSNSVRSQSLEIKVLMKSKFFNNKATALCMFGILLLVSIQTSNSERVFKAHRGLQYDKEGSAFGTQKNKFDFLAKSGWIQPHGGGFVKCSHADKIMWFKYVSSRPNLLLTQFFN